MKIAILADSNSGITQKMAKEMGVFIIPTPFFINDNIYYEDVTMSQEDFYKALKDDKIDIKTSMPSIGDTADLWDKLLEEYDELVYIPISSGLSGTCEAATMLSKDYDGKVEVVNNRRVSVTQFQSILDALFLAENGKSAKEIKHILEEHSANSAIYVALDTLKYLKKGGRITPAAAAIGTLLNLKPILQIQGDKLDAYAKCRGKAQARKGMIDAVKNDLETRFKPQATNKNLSLYLAYSGNLEEAQSWKEEVSAAFPDYEINMQPLSLSVASHIGHGCLAIACSEMIKEV